MKRRTARAGVALCSKEAHDGMQEIHGAGAPRGAGAWREGGGKRARGSADDGAELDRPRESQRDGRDDDEDAERDGGRDDGGRDDGGVGADADEGCGHGGWGVGSPRRS